MGTIRNKKSYHGYILHGWTYSIDKYKKITSLLNLKGLKTTILKVPGLTAKIEKSWDLNDYILWLKKIVNKEKDRVVLIGHSNGGRIALNFTIKYPQKLAHLILIDSAGIYHNNLAVNVKRIIFKNVAKIGKKLSASEKLRNILYKIVGERDYKNADPLMRKTMINLIDSDKMLDLANVNIPTLIIWGKKDKTAPLSDGIIMHESIKNSKLHIIDVARHSPQFTHTKEVADVILKTLKV